MEIGKPVYWDEERKSQAIEVILFEIAENGKSLRKILDNADRTIFPSNVTFCQWLKDDTNLAKQYARACEIRADKIFEEILEIADESHNDTIIDPETGNEITNHEVIQRARLKVDARKWMLAKMNPKVYGDKTDITTNGKEITTGLHQLTDEQLQKELERLNAK